MKLTSIVARRLAPGLLACAALAFPSSASAATPCADAGLMPTRTNSTQVRAATLCLMNQQRASRGLAPLKSNRQLLKAARRYSRLMVRKRFVGHVSPGGSTLVSRVRKGTRYLRGANGWALAENIAWGSGARATPALTVKSWMSSSAHRRNILRRDLRHIGIGVASGAPRRTSGFAAATYTADFGRR